MKSYKRLRIIVSVLIITLITSALVANHYKEALVVEYHYFMGLHAYDNLDVELARTYFEKAAVTGHKNSISSLLNLYQVKGGLFGQRNSKRAQEYYEKIALFGYPDIQFKVGEIYKGQSIRGGIKPAEKAMHWLKQAADSGHTDAALELALLGLQSNFKYYDRENALQYLQLAVNRQSDKAKDYLFLWDNLIAARTGDANAMLVVAEAYRRGVDVAQNSDSAFRWYRMAHNMGMLEGTYHVANYRRLNNKTSKKLALTVAKTGDKRGYFLLGQLYEDDLDYGYEYSDNEEVKAKAWQNYITAARLGHIEAQDRVARIYAYGKGSDYQPLKAAYWYKQIAQNTALPEHLLELKTDAIDVLIDMHMDEEIALDPEMLTKYFTFVESQAKDGSWIAQTLLGEIFSGGKGLPRDEKKAEYWWLKVAEQKSSFSTEAMAHLATLYHFGSSSIQDYQKAIYWYKEVVERSDKPHYLFNLAALYQLGKGVDRSEKKANRLYDRAFTQVVDGTNKHTPLRWVSRSTQN